ncbi:hypothetical protein LguiB_003166 [Lonicera macranthoides]
MFELAEFSKLNFQSSFTETKQVLSNHSIRVVESGMGDCHKLGKKHKTSLNFIKCILIVFNALN